MNSLSLFLVVSLIFAASTVSAFRMEEYETQDSVDEEFARNLQSKFLLFLKLSKPSHHVPKYRTPRDSFKTCGQKIVEYTRQVCGSLDSEANTQTDISTKCCGAKCSDDFIRKAMCPDKLNS